jgi:hypothetical protein
MFFYFTAPRDRGRAHFWCSYDLETRKISDNRYHIMQIIACSPDTPRFPPPYHEVDVFEIQNKVIESILGDVEQQEAAAIVNERDLFELGYATHLNRGAGLYLGL